MKFNSEMQLAEILARGDRFRKKREQHILYGITASACGLLLLLCVCIGNVIVRVPAEYDHSLYGSFLLSQEAGGYVMAAVIAFTLGVIVTVLIFRHRHRTGQNRGSREER
ncbi:MAG: hypothetical protein IJP92_05255 [Lachnospiraceae bacterium]|nr:hypothetical protein [Lachnospiraceae bacterium]